MYERRGGGASGSAGVQHSFVGRNAVGAAQETLVSLQWLMKKITLASSGLIVSIGASLQVQSSAVDNFLVALFADNAGSPRELLSASGDIKSSATLLLTTVNGQGVRRWFHRPVGYYAAAGDYWIGCSVGSDAAIDTRIDLDTTGGTDRTYTSGDLWVADAGFYTVTTTVKNYSIRASVLS